MLKVLCFLACLGMSNPTFEEDPIGGEDEEEPSDPHFPEQPDFPIDEE